MAPLALAPASRAQSPLELAQTPVAISGLDRQTGIGFAAQAKSPDVVVIDATIGAKRIHAEFDYAAKTVAVRSLSAGDGQAARLAPQDIAAFQRLLASRPAIDTRARRGEALASFLNLMANAPSGVIDIRPSASQTFTSICADIGRKEYAVYKLDQVIRQIATVGPACYVKPALGRCGAGAGPDPVIGFVQRFTQQCLNHDQCCNATGDRFVNGVDVCGKAGTLECIPEFNAAAPGFFYAPDCGTTAGDWRDNFGATFALTGGDSAGPSQAFSGNEDTVACGVWRVFGVRQGKAIRFLATNPNPSKDCGGWAKFSGSYGNCNVARGAWTSSLGQQGVWGWTRTAPVRASLENATAIQTFRPDPYRR